MGRRSPGGACLACLPSATAMSPLTCHLRRAPSSFAGLARSLRKLP
ncbi:hypothetical protein EBI_26593 [Enterocytozoon bieneusi H348]|nr:hypothetical protein EBI_26593 [Enterocytozoon bieneusi H348]|eukprot:XP_002652232.1 hypothetical protein EBI_26593 [Enterocytozoon bieneusi H348]